MLPAAVQRELTDRYDLEEEPVYITNFSKEFESKSEIEIRRSRPQQEQRGSATNFGEGVLLPTMTTTDVGEQKITLNKSLSESAMVIEPERHCEGMSGNNTENMPPVPTPGWDETAGISEIEATSESVVGEDYMAAQTQTHGGEVELGELGHKYASTPGAIELTESSSIDAEIDMHLEVPRKGGDCDRVYVHRFALMFCTFSLLALFVVCFIFYPDPVELCLNLSLDDEDIMGKGLHDKGSYQLNITNPNSVDVHIHDLEITAYYGGVAEENGLLNTEKMDYHIPAHGTLSKNQTYTFAQNCTDAVPIATLNGCFNGYRAYIIYEIVTSFKACVLSFICHEGIVSKSDYKSDCTGGNEMVCTELGFFQFGW